MLTIFVAQAANWNPSGSWWEYISRFIAIWTVTLFPFVLILLLSILLISQYKKANRIRQRSYEHMDRIEAKTDEMIALLKEIRDKQ